MVYLIKIETLPASVRLRNVFLKAGIETLGDIFAMTTDELRSCRGFSDVILLELHYILAEFGFLFMGKEFYEVNSRVLTQRYFDANL